MASEDYPGAEMLAANMRRRWPWLSKHQAYVMACIKIRPDRNRNGMHVGWDAMRRPVVETDREMANTRPRLIATLRNGNSTDPKYPITYLEAEEAA